MHFLGGEVGEKSLTKEKPRRNDMEAKHPLSAECKTIKCPCLSCFNTIAPKYIFYIKITVTKKTLAYLV